MFQFAPNVLSLLLIVATTCMGMAPAGAPCVAADREPPSKSCCGLCCATESAASRTCCARSEELNVCTCLADEERPATPRERRGSDERDARRAEWMATATVIHVTGPQIRVIQDGLAFSFLSYARHQAVLCRWLI